MSLYYVISCKKLKNVRHLFVFATINIIIIIINIFTATFSLLFVRYINILTVMCVVHQHSHCYVCVVHQDSFCYRYVYGASTFSLLFVRCINILTVMGVVHQHSHCYVCVVHQDSYCYRYVYGATTFS